MALRLNLAVLPVAVLLAATAAAQGDVEKTVSNPKAIHDAIAKQSQQVVEKLLRLQTPQTPFDYINFYLSGPVVVLTGFTSKSPLKNEAESQVKTLAWVEHVVNEVQVLGVTPELRSLRASILANLTQALPQAFPLGHANVRIKVTEDFQVTLAGVVNRYDKTTLEAALVQIKQMPLVKSVTSQVVVTPE